MDEQQFTQQKSVSGNDFQIYEIIFVSYIWTKDVTCVTLQQIKSHLKFVH
jgi:hypothetical protein